MRRRTSLQWALGVCLVCIFAGFIVIMMRSEQSLDINGRRYSVKVASTDVERSKGLGGKEKMAAHEGMLFVFDPAAVQCFWMKDMRFSIDIIWLDAQKRVVHVEPNVSPNTYPQSFCPYQSAKYVVELNAGQASQSAVKVGEKLRF